MLPSILAREVRTSLRDQLRASFGPTTKSFDRLIEDFVKAPDTLIKGPWLTLELPFRRTKSDAEFFPDIPLGFRAYSHQQKAFRQLSGDRPRSSIVATGTASGKTECFLYPILDVCIRAKGQGGVKAIIIYPMNALAADQARRIAALVAKTPVLAGVRVGIGCPLEHDPKQRVDRVRNEVPVLVLLGLQGNKGEVAQRLQAVSRTVSLRVHRREAELRPSLDVQQEQQPVHVAQAFRRQDAGVQRVLPREHALLLLAALFDGQRRRLVAEQFDRLPQRELQVLGDAIGVPVTFLVDAVDQGRAGLRRERRRVQERGDGADRREIFTAENLAEVEAEQAALAPLLAVDEHGVRHRQQDHESRGLPQGEDALVDGGLGRVLPPLLDVDRFVDPLELLAPETEVEGARLEVGVARRHGLHDPHAIAPSGVGAQRGNRKQLLLGVGNQPEIALVTEGAEEFVGELAEDRGAASGRCARPCNRMPAVANAPRPFPAGGRPAFPPAFSSSRQRARSSWTSPSKTVWR